jgi:tRNA A37 threonylcarbamoyladenosine dehydratase
VHEVEDFVQPDNWPALLPVPVDVLIDACDQVGQGRAGRLGAAAAGAAGVRGCGGRQAAAELVEVDDLGATTHDPLLASLRQRLRKAHVAPRRGDRRALRVLARARGGRAVEGCDVPGRRRWPVHGYGSTVTVTATFGLVAAGKRSNNCRAVAWLKRQFRYNAALRMGSLAQSVEQRTFNPLVAGSNPARPTNRAGLVTRALSSVGRAADS